MISRFFIERPIFAAVIAIVITLAGVISIPLLPIAEYPDIVPPVVEVTATYPGADARVLADTVAAPIEQEVNGVERTLYMRSQCTNDGSYVLNVTFENGTDIGLAQVLVQNRVALATAQLPELVQRLGISVRKKSPALLLAVNLYSPTNRYDALYMSNYATIQIRDELARLPGVGDVRLLGQQKYSMRAWVNPKKLATRGLDADDVVRAIDEQNKQVIAGHLGQPPSPRGLDFEYVMTAQGLLDDKEEFGDIVVKTIPGKNEVVRLRDVARVELGAQSLDQSATLDGKPSVMIATFQLPGSNALDTANAIKAKMKELRTRFPDGLEYVIAYDTTPFISESIREVVKTLFEAFLLVAIVVLVFLQDWRASLIPLIAVPVSIVGTFAVMIAAGFSANNISLLGLVLAIGIVVDDAIVVVENVSRHLEAGLPAKEAARKAMDEVSGAIIAVSTVLCAVFVPCAFITGIAGLMFRQFAITIAVSTLISLLNSLTLTPALAALLLRSRDQRPDIVARALDRTLGWFFRGFNRSFEFTRSIYASAVSRLLRISAIVLVGYVGLLYLTGKTLGALPKGFLPEQDKGYLIVTAQLPDAASLERTEAIARRIEKIALATEGVAHTVAVTGQSFVLGVPGSNLATIFVPLASFEERRDRSSNAVLLELTKKLADIPEAVITVLGAPSIQGLATTAGVKIELEDRGGLGPKALQEQAANLIEKGGKLGKFTTLFTAFRANTPQKFIAIDRTKCKSLGVPLKTVFDTLQVYLGGYYVNLFVKFGRTWQVNIQAEPSTRVTPEDVALLKVRSPRGTMIPLGTLTSIEDASGPLVAERYNLYPAAPVIGLPAPGVSLGDAVSGLEGICMRELPRQMTFEWTEVVKLQQLAGNVAMYVLALSVVLVFLTLAALYESWLLPFAVILVVPMCMLLAGVGIALRGGDIDMFAQIGFVVLIGLACKNAILIVEWARELRAQGKPLQEATVEAASVRLRPILMTSFAFILGVFPLVVAKGAGAEMRRGLGVAVFSGMLGVTIFGLFLTPVFFAVLGRVRKRARPAPAPREAPVPAAAAARAMNPG